jgi:hypothetical protein
MAPRIPSMSRGISLLGRAGLVTLRAALLKWPIYVDFTGKVPPVEPADSTSTVTPCFVHNR